MKIGDEVTVIGKAWIVTGKRFKHVIPAFSQVDACAYGVTIGCHDPD